MPKTHTERRARKAIYIDGRACGPHTHTPVLYRVLEEASFSSAGTEICLQCAWPGVIEICPPCKFGYPRVRIFTKFGDPIRNLGCMKSHNN